MIPPLGFWRGCWLLATLSLRRWVNRIASGQSARQLSTTGGPPPGPRPPTGRKRVGSLVLMLLVLPFAGLQMGFGSWRYSEAVSGYGYIHQTPDVSTISAIAIQLQINHESDADESARWWSVTMRILEKDAALQDLSKEQRALVTAGWRTAITAHGVAWTQGMTADGHATGMARGVSLALLVICTYLLATSLGMSNQDLGQVEWSLLWFATLPVNNRVLLAAQWLNAVLFNMFAWMVLPPFLLVIGIHGGWGWWSVAFAGIAGLASMAIIAATRVVIETWLRLHLNGARLKNIQAGATLLSLCMMVAIYACAFGTTPTWFLHVATALPWDYQPFGWLVRMPFVQTGAMWSGIAGLALAMCVSWLMLALGERWLSGGLIDSSGVWTGSRAAGRRHGGWQPLSLLRKDVLLLLRDRTVMVQILVFPILMMVLQLVINPGLVHAIATSFRHASALIFVLGANVLANSATSVLIIEGSALWILCAAPQALQKLLLQKVALWASLALIYACIALTVALIVVPFGAAAVGDAIMVLIGLPIYAVIGAGLGAAATDPLEVTPQRRMRPDTVFLFLILIGMYTQALYTADLHGRIAYVVLSLVLAYALWQRLADRLPYLLDPAARPPRDLALSDGALAAMTFLVSQGILQMFLLQAGVEMATAMVWAFAGSGVLAAIVTLGILMREKVQGLWRVSGLWPTHKARGPFMSLLIGLGAGAAAAGVAAVWLVMVRRNDWFHTVDGEGLSMPFTTLVILTVVLAPLCEEFIFRGLVYGGLRRTLPIRWAIPAAAAIFAIVHPSISVVPVFALGVATACAYQATGWLLAPIIAHALYNFVVVALQV